MKFNLRHFVFITISLVYGTTIVMAESGEFNNLCAYGLTGGQSVKTGCIINETINNKTYCFGSQEAKTEFLKDLTGNIQKASDNFQEIQAQLNDGLDSYTPKTGSVTKDNDWINDQLQRRIDRNIVSPGARDDKELEWSKTRDF